jgi:predicted Zn-ribbon and HTH transcriptional regulator
MVAKKLEAKIQRIEEKLKRIEDVLELGDIVTTFDWKDFSVLDKSILDKLLEKGREGSTTTEIAQELNLNEPETSGRTIIYTRLKRIERISRRIKGIPIIVPERKRWYLNYEDFRFPEVKKDERVEEVREKS